MLPVDALRVLVATSVLAFAAITDLRWRRAPDACWWVIAGAGLLFLGYDAWQTPGFFETHLPQLAVAGLVLVIALVGYYTGLVAGGADAKAMMSLAVLAPLPLGAAWMIPWPSPFPFVLTALVNGLLVALLVPLGLFILNLVRGDLEGWHTFLGFRVDLEHVDLGVVWPVEYLDEDGQRRIAASPRSVPEEALDPAWLAEHGIDRPWVTPKVPFLVPLWFGVVLAVLAGDPVVWMIEAFA